MATLVEIAGQLVAAHAANTQLTTEELLVELNNVHAALKNLEEGHPIEGAAEAKPAMTLKEAFRKNEVVCMICGQGGYKTLGRHLRTSHQLEPAAYKKQFGIPSKQSLCSKNYTESRRQMAIDLGLGAGLAKARGIRMANVEATKIAAAKSEKVKAPAKVTTANAKVKAPAKTKVPAKTKNTK